MDNQEMLKFVNQLLEREVNMDNQEMLKFVNQLLERVDILQAGFTEIIEYLIRTKDDEVFVLDKIQTMREKIEKLNKIQTMREKIEKFKEA